MASTVYLNLLVQYEDLYIGVGRRTGRRPLLWPLPIRATRVPCQRRETTEATGEPMSERERHRMWMCERCAMPDGKRQYNESITNKLSKTVSPLRSQTQSRMSADSRPCPCMAVRCGYGLCLCALRTALCGPLCVSRLVTISKIKSKNSYCYSVFALIARCCCTPAPPPADASGSLHESFAHECLKSSLAFRNPVTAATSRRPARADGPKVGLDGPASLGAGRAPWQ